MKRKEKFMLPGVNPYVVAGLVVYIGMCAGMIAQKHGKNPVLYGLLAVISPFNLILLGLWAFGPFERGEEDK
jgi:hypothetical protein